MFIVRKLAVYVKRGRIRLNCQAENICNDFPTWEIMQSVRSMMRDVVSDKRQSRQTLSSVGKYAGCVKRGK